MKEDKFMQGYICCVCAIIRSHGIDTPVIEAYKAGAGKSTLKELKDSGVDSYDLELLKQHWQELNYRQP